MSVKPVPGADFNFAAEVLEFIRKAPPQPYEQGGVVDRIDLLQCFDCTLTAMMRQHAERFSSGADGFDLAEKSINSALPVLMIAYAERHRFRFQENLVGGFRFSTRNFAAISAAKGQDELAERLGALDRLRQGNIVAGTKQKILAAANEVFRTMRDGNDRIDFALSILKPLVQGGRLSQQMAVVLLTSLLEKPGDMEFFDAGWFRMVEAVSAGKVEPRTELYWHIFLRRAMRYGGGVPEQPLLLLAIRASDPFWFRASRSVGNTRLVWDMRNLRARLRFSDDGKISAGVKVRPRDKPRQQMIALLDGIEDAGIGPHDLNPQSQDAIRGAMALHAPAEGAACLDESSWAMWALSAARSVQLAEFLGLLTRFNLEGDNGVHAWIMRRFFIECGGAYRSAALGELAMRARIPRAKADQILARVSLDAEELIEAWQRTNESGREMKFADFIRMASSLQESTADRISGTGSAAAPAEQGLMLAIARQLSKTMPEVYGEVAEAPTIAVVADFSEVELSPDELAWSTQISDPSVRSLILARHESALKEFMLAADLRTRSAGEDLSDLVKNLCGVAGASMARPGEGTESFVKSAMDLAASACCLLVAREIQMGRWHKHSQARTLQFVARRFANLSARPVFSRLFAALAANGVGRSLDDARALGMGKGYDALGILKRDEREFMQASFKLRSFDAGDLAAHWDTACARLQRAPAFDEAFYASVALLNDVEAANASRKAAGGEEFAGLVWKARRTWAILALRNRTRIRSMKAIYNRMAGFLPALRNIPLDDFKAAMGTHGPDEVPLEKVIQFYVAKAAWPVSAGESPAPAATEAAPAADGEMSEEEAIADSESSAEGAAQAALAGGLGVAGLSFKPA